MRSIAELQKREDCKAKLRERVLWGFSEENLAALNRAVAENCKALKPDSTERRNCERSLAEALRRNPVTKTN